MGPPETQDNVKNQITSLPVYIVKVHICNENVVRPIKITIHINLGFDEGSVSQRSWSLVRESRNPEKYAILFLSKVVSVNVSESMTVSCGWVGFPNNQYNVFQCIFLNPQGGPEIFQKVLGNIPTEEWLRLTVLVMMPHKNMAWITKPHGYQNPVLTHFSLLRMLLCNSCRRPPRFFSHRLCLKGVQRSR